MLQVHVGWIANGCGILGNGFCDNCNASITQYEPITEYGVLKRFSSSVDPIQMANGGYVVYTNVTETTTCEEVQNCDNGRIEFEYSIFKPLTVDPVIQNLPVNKFWRTGNLINERAYNSSGALVSEISYFYNASPAVQIKGLKAGDRQFNLYQTSNPSNAPCMVRWVVDAVVYKYENEKFFLERKIEKKFDQINPSKFTTTEYNYTYNNALQLVLTETVQLESQEYSKQIIRYPSNYLSCQNCSSGQAAALKFMKHEDNRYWSVPIEVLNLKKLNGEYYVVSGEIQEYEVFSNKLILIGKSTLHLNEPIAESNFQLSSIAGEQFTKHPSYFIQEKVHKVNSNLNTISLQRTYGLSQTLLRDYPDDKVVATVVNAEIEQCAFTSFETSTGNGWNYSSSSCMIQSITHLDFQLPKSYTGNKYFVFNNNNVTSQSMMAGRYKLSFWTISSTPLNITISNNANLLNSFVNLSNNHPYWKYNEYEINSASEFIVTISGLNGSLIDELRLVPYESQIKTECFNTDGTVISTCDENSVVRLFTYDSWKRVEWILDQKLQVISKSEYHFQDPSNPNDHNWSKTIIALEPNLARTAISNANPSSPSISSNISYEDGFGRVIQNIGIRQSPSKRDIVSFRMYDSFGREKIKYSPFTLGNGNNGGFIEDVQLKQLNFYNTSPKVAKTQFPFSEYVFESSPQSRVIEKGNVGETWQIGNGHTTRMSYELNGENEVLHWALLPNGCSALGEFGPSHIPVNSLFKNSIIDENGKEFWEFRNHQGQLICKRTKVLMSGEGATSYSWYNGFGHDSDDNMSYLPGLAPTWRNMDTYYVYDSFGNLAYEIPPIAILAMNGNYQFFSDTDGVNYQIFDGYITANKYDKNGNLSESKKPGEVWAKFAYNRLGRLVAHQKPSSISETNKWHFNKYDTFGRIIQTGLFESSLTRAQMQTMLDLQESGLWETKTGNLSSPYTEPATKNRTKS
ncbi:MAG: DUF6443 domain-containing protein [Flavobacteriales bacterium]